MSGGSAFGEDSLSIGWPPGAACWGGTATSTPNPRSHIIGSHNHPGRNMQNAFLPPTQSCRFFFFNLFGCTVRHVGS